MSLLYAFFGDDFTGSTDVLEQLATVGIPAALFLAPPTPEQLAQFPGILALGVAGDSRSRSPHWMDTHLPELFRSLRHLDAPVTHYKTCSTFDSSPTTGSIGRAIELARGIFPAPFVPLVVGTPHLRRYLLFGHLFAAGPSGEILRIDRHPIASHPVTPMRESDLRRHLALQTDLPIGLLDVNDLTSCGHAAAALNRELALNHELLFLDTFDNHTQSVAGELLWTQALRHRLFAAGSSGLTTALISSWRVRNLIPAAPPVAHPGAAAPLLVLSGSCSPVTASQIRYALSHGFNSIALDPAYFADSAASNSTINDTINAVMEALASGHSTVLYTALGDPAQAALGNSLGIALGRLLHQILTHMPSLHRVLLCGGDTSSHALQQLGLTALTWRANLQPGAPLCRAHGLAHPLELVLKGGQIGTEDFFLQVQRGDPQPSTPAA